MIIAAVVLGLVIIVFNIAMLTTMKLRMEAAKTKNTKDADE